MDLDLSLSGNYKIAEKVWLWNFNKTGNFSVLHDFPVPSESFVEALPIPGPIHVTVSLDKFQLKVAATLEGILTVYSHTFNIETELTALVKGNSKTWTFPDFEVLGVSVLGLSFKATLN